jgi:hypothetical protein
MYDAEGDGGRQRERDGEMYGQMKGGREREMEKWMER